MYEQTLKKVRNSFKRSIELSKTIDSARVGVLYEITTPRLVSERFQSAR